MSEPVGPALRKRLEQRLGIGDTHVEIGGLQGRPLGNAAALAEARGALMMLADGGPFNQWFDEHSGGDALKVDVQARTTPVELVQSICAQLGRQSQHFVDIEDDLDRFATRLAIAARERTGLTMPRVSDVNSIWCRHYATTVSRAYAEHAHHAGIRVDAAVLFVMGLPQCDASDGELHAWNWLVDFDSGTVRSFEPQDAQRNRTYANVSSLLYTFANLRTRATPVPGLRRFVRSHTTLHGATILFHLARHPIDRASRRHIVERLRAGRFERAVPDWEAELADWNATWGDGVDVGDIVRYSDA